MTDGSSSKSSSFNEVLDKLAPFVPLVSALIDWRTPVVVGLAAYGTHRVGLFRAVKFFVSTWWRNKPYVRSIRSKEVEDLTETLQILKRGDYIIVQGPKGVGKTCLVETVIANRPAAISVLVNPGTSSDAIEEKVYYAITNTSKSLSELKGSALRVLRWCQFFVHPVVVLQVRERTTGESYAKLAPVTRNLADAGIRVIIDASNNSLDSAIFTGRQKVLNIDLLSRDQLTEITELTPLCKSLQDHQLFDTVFEILGGSPLYFGNLLTYINKRKVSLTEGTSATEMRTVVYAFVQDYLSTGPVEIITNALKRNGQVQQLFDKFAPPTNASFLSNQDIVSTGVSDDVLDKVFRKVKSPDFVKTRKLVYVPSSPAIWYFLRNKLNDIPPIDQMFPLGTVSEIQSDSNKTH